MLEPIYTRDTSSKAACDRGMRADDHSVALLPALLSEGIGDLVLESAWRSSGGKWFANVVVNSLIVW